MKHSIAQSGNLQSLDVFNWTPNHMPDTELEGSIMLQYIYHSIRIVEPF